MELSKTVQQNPNLVVTNIDGDLVILHPDTGEYYGAKVIGNQIWQMMAEPIVVNTMVDKLTAEYDAERETIAEDVASFLDDLLNEGLILAQDS